MKKAVVNRILNDKGEMLFMLRNTKPFGWGLVGGKIDPDDKDAMAACIRETEEESGIKLTPEQIVFIGEDKSYNGTPVSVFETKLDHTPVVKRSPREHLNYRWVKAHDYKYHGNYTNEIRTMFFSGKTLSFVSLGREHFFPEFLTRPWGQKPTGDYD